MTKSATAADADGVAAPAIIPGIVVPASLDIALSSAPGGVGAVATTSAQPVTLTISEILAVPSTNPATSEVSAAVPVQVAGAQSAIETPCGTVAATGDEGESV